MFAMAIVGNRPSAHRQRIGLREAADRPGERRRGQFWRRRGCSDPDAVVGAIPHDALEGYAVIGELALDGTVSAVAGVLPAAIAANAAERGLICPSPCGPEAAWASADLNILAAVKLTRLAIVGEHGQSGVAAVRRMAQPRLGNADWGDADQPLV